MALHEPLGVAKVGVVQGIINNLRFNLRFQLQPLPHLPYDIFADKLGEGTVLR